MRSRRLIVGPYAGGNARAPTAVGDHQAFGLELGICAGNRVRGDAEIARQLPDGRKCIACPQFTALDEVTELIHDLLERREIRIDYEEKIGHGVDEDCRPRYVQ